MVKTLSYILGAVLLVVGLLGFVNNPVLGLFAVNGAHDLVHILTGLALIILAMQGGKTLSSGLIVLGVVYALVTLLGFILIPAGGMLLGFIEVNTLDHYLHLVLTLAFLALGFAQKNERVAARV